MNKIQIIKLAVTTIVGAGTTKIVASILENNVNTDKTIDKVTVPAAGAVIGLMAADLTKRYTDAKIDQIAEWVDQNVTKK